MTRRSLLALPALRLPAAPRARVTREIFLRSPAQGTAVFAHAWYTEPSGLALTSVEQRFSRSDTVDIAFYRHSRDNGRTWSAPVAHNTGERRPQGMLRRHPRTIYVDPPTGRAIEFWIEGILPTDDPLEGMRQWNIFYRIGPRGAPRQIIHEGAGFHARHAIPDLYTGRNCLMLGDVASVPLTLPNGEILLPAIMTPLAGNLGGGYTYTDAIVLHARWRGDRLLWRSADPVKADPARSTRGMDEPTLARLPDGRLIMLMRGSNDRKPDLPGHRWISVSTDGGWRWTDPAPWTYTDGAPFFSPSAASQLLRHSTGRLFWLGHISAQNPRGNRPRYPFYIGELDQRTGLLIRDSLVPIDDLQPGEDPILALTSTYTREDRETHEIALHMTRMFTTKAGFAGDAMLYRITV